PVARLDGSRPRRRAAPCAHGADVDLPQRRERSAPHTRYLGDVAHTDSELAARRAAVARQRMETTRDRGARRNGRVVRTLAAARLAAVGVRGLSYSAACIFSSIAFICACTRLTAWSG